MMSRLLPLVLLAATLPARAETVERYLGYATDARDGRYLYTEVHQHRYDGRRWLGGSMRYYAPDGQLLAEKQLDFSQSPYLPLMRYRAGSSYEDSITRIDERSVQLSTRRDRDTTVKVLPRRPNQAADSGFNAYLVDHLDELAAGRAVALRLVVVGQRDEYRFRARPLGRLRIDGEDAIRLSVEPDSLLRWLVDPLEVVYGLDSRRLLRYQGISNILDPRTGKAYVVRISYGEKPAGTPARLPAP